MERRMIKVGERLRKAREDAGYSQELLAEKICCSAITVSRWENGHTSMKTIDIICVVEVLGVSADYLLGIERGEEQIEDMILSLSVFNREIVINTLKAMISAMKS